MNRSIAETWLKKALNNNQATFRDGQWEAIDAIVNRKKKLVVVQRTGWGKSIVYFLATRLLRNQGYGPTLIVSPLLALMRNQIQAAQQLGLVSVTINSTNKEQWDNIISGVVADKVDTLLISPERLANEKFNSEVLYKIASKVGLLVVDEAHCISDWGHDFRPDYRRIVQVLKRIPRNVPVLGTTATANNRVIRDIQQQLGNVEIQRGPLRRESLHLQAIHLEDQAQRMAWLLENIPKMPGTGIIYTQTTNDAERVAKWLAENGIPARAYHSNIHHEDFSDTNSYRIFLEELLLENKIKALVATSALGMGYDKPDIGFVVHFQAPSSIVSYYQQVGRAGRAVEKAYGILLSGKEDEDIYTYFKETAFPDEEHVNRILNILEQYDGLSAYQLQGKVNLNTQQIDKVLKILSVENPAPVIKEGSKWYRTPVSYRLDKEKIARLNSQKDLEWQEVKTYIGYEGCFMQYLCSVLDDPDQAPCGKCSNCHGKPLFGMDVQKSNVIRAVQFLRRSEFPIKPRKQLISGALQEYKFRTNLPVELQAEEGRVLSRWGDAGYGSWVADDKHNGFFRDELVKAIAEMITQRWKPDPFPTWVTCVPSHRHPELVPDFARRVANKLKLPFVDAIKKVKENQPQKLMHNRYHQIKNLDGVFTVDGLYLDEPVFLIDDIIDSGHTFMLLAALLKQHGSGPVYPVALASTTKGNN
ncbi:MAG: RecQ family ATP-dependent DNA helicase [Calditrichia bacterium]